MSNLVQPIAVSKDTDHYTALAVVAVASVLARLDDPANPTWATWDANSHTKTVRRTPNPAALADKLTDQVTAVASHSGAFACALAPQPADDLPRPVARLQVSGLDLPRTPDAFRTHSAPLFTVTVNDDMAMTTGKAAAQVAHVVHEHLIHRCTAQQREAWVADPFAFEIVSAPQTDVATIAERPQAVFVIDNGHTEVAPGSLTAVLEPARLH